MADLTPQEQLMLELINRARMDPNGEAKRFNIALNEGVSNGDKISTSPKEILAGNDDLHDVADNHSDWMLTNDIFSHNEQNGTPKFTGKDPGDRMEAAGYAFTGSWSNGENIAVSGTTASMTSSEQTRQIIQQHKDLFVDEGIAGRGHRLNILNEGFQEVGIGQQEGKFTFDDGAFNSSMVTQDFARSGDKLFVTGVVYNDKVVKDNFFSVGEQVANLSISGSGESDKTGAGGGYELAFAGGGTKSIDFGAVTVDVTVGTVNAKVDLVNGKEIWTNADIASTSSNVKELHALSIADVDLSAGAGAQKIFGNSGENHIDGGRGLDKLYGKGGADAFVFADGDTSASRSKADTIFDFKADDTVDLKGWDANSNEDGIQGFAFIGSQAFHGEAGELHFVKQKSDTWIEGDTDGNGKADFVIHLDDAVKLSGNNFDL